MYSNSELCSLTTGPPTRQLPLSDWDPYVSAWLCLLTLRQRERTGERVFLFLLEPNEARISSRMWALCHLSLLAPIWGGNCYYFVVLSCHSNPELHSILFKRSHGQLLHANVNMLLLFFGHAKRPWRRNLLKEEFIWADGSRWLRVHCGGNALPQADMAAGVVSWGIISQPQEQRRVSVGHRARLYNLTTFSLLDVLPPTRLELCWPLNFPKQHHQLANKSSNTWANGKRVSLKPL